MSFFGRLFGKNPERDMTPVQQASATEQPSAEDLLWDRVYEARKSVYEHHFGAFPPDILKLGDLTGVWPGGGLYVLAADRLGSNHVVYTTFGLSNPDMPASVVLEDVVTESDGTRQVSLSGTLKRKENVRPKTDRPGYGYEIMVVATENAQWPLWILQWAAKAEILKDADLLGLVEKHRAISVETIQIGGNQSVHLLIAKAQAPLLQSADLPNGRLENLVATVITEDEMQWARKNGGVRLLEWLRESGVGQISALDRQSVLQGLPATGSGQASTPMDFSRITSLELAKGLETQGQLLKVLTFPAELGGTDIPPNVIYIPIGSAQERALAIETIKAWVSNGQIDNLQVRPEYKGSSFIPSKLHMMASHSANSDSKTLTIDIW